MKQGFAMMLKCLSPCLSKSWGDRKENICHTG